jgi:hypothetical protein
MSLLTQSRAEAIIVRDILARFVKRVHPGADVVVEPARQPGTRRPDILVTLENGTRYAIDVSIVDPAAQSHIAGGDLSSLQVAGGAAKQAEMSKVAAYRGTDYAGTLVPFIVEATGRLGPKASKFLETIGGAAARRKGMFLFDVNLVLARAMGRCGTHLRSKLHGAGAL